jgi:D-galactose 1-dehydrogenase
LEQKVSYKIAIIGMGKIATDQHVPVIATDPNFELAAVVSQRGAYPAGVPGFRTQADLLGSLGDLDAVAICTPPSARHAIAREALEAGKHVLLEKPPTQTLAELQDLTEFARKRERVLFTAWHSQFNAAVREARKRLKDQNIRMLDIEWKEDVRRWHPGQDWIWRAGGFGVFDPGINALSIVTSILPGALLLRSADLFYPSNRETPIAAQLEFDLVKSRSDRLYAEFDWRQTGEQSWNITVETSNGSLLMLRNGGARLEIDGNVVLDEQPAEYEGIYRRFAELLSNNRSHVDAAPQQLVADAFTIGRRRTVDLFEN